MGLVYDLLVKETKEKPDTVTVLTFSSVLYQRKNVFAILGQLQ